MCIRDSDPGGRVPAPDRTNAGRLMSASLSTPTPQPTPRSTTQPRLPAPAPWRPVFGSWLTAYKRTWRGSIFGRFVSPLLFLLSIGLGLGSLVNKSAGGVGGVPYLQFVVPGIVCLLYTSPSP